MANDLNSVAIIGRLTRDPEHKTVGETSLCNFSIASNRKVSKDKQDTYFFECEVWGKLADILKQYGGKGKQIAIKGSLKQDTWDTPDGKKASKVKIRVEEIELLGGKQDTSTDTPDIDYSQAPDDIF